MCSFMYIHTCVYIFIYYLPQKQQQYRHKRGRCANKRLIANTKPVTTMNIVNMNRNIRAKNQQTE